VPGADAVDQRAKSARDRMRPSFRSCGRKAMPAEPR
jgi:hypothetical protein